MGFIKRLYCVSAWIKIVLLNYFVGLENGTRDRQAHVAIEMPAEKGKSKVGYT